MDPIKALEIASANTERLVRGVGADQWTAPTPCAEWDVRALVNHATWTMHFINAALDGTRPPAPEADLIGADPGDAFARATRATLERWRAVPSLDDPVTLPFGAVPGSVTLGINTLDVYTHAWDIARATGQDAGLDDEMSAGVLAFAQQVIPGAGREGRFGPEVPIADDAPATDRMLAYLGRRP